MNSRCERRMTCINTRHCRTSLIHLLAFRNHSIRLYYVLQYWYKPLLGLLVYCILHIFRANKEHITTHLVHFIPEVLIAYLVLVFSCDSTLYIYFMIYLFFKIDKIFWKYLNNCIWVCINKPFKWTFWWFICVTVSHIQFWKETHNFNFISCFTSHYLLIVNIYQGWPDFFLLAGRILNHLSLRAKF